MKKLILLTFVSVVLSSCKTGTDSVNYNVKKREYPTVETGDIFETTYIPVRVKCSNPRPNRKAYSGKIKTPEEIEQLINQQKKDSIKEYKVKLWN